MYTLEQIKQIAPTVFATDKMDHLTDRYIQTPTSRVVEDLMDLGWQVTKAQEVKARKNKGFQKHIVIFRHPNIMISGKEGDDVQPQIILTNSHDGKNAFNFRVGLYRFICSNGLVIADAEFSNVSIRHMNYTFETLKDNITEIVSKLPGLVQKINLFKSISLSYDQMVDFAVKAALLRTKQTVNASDLLAPIRLQDQGNGLWEVFNRVQEKLIGGHYTSGKRKTRPVTSFQTNIDINERLWKLAEQYA